MPETEIPIRLCPNILKLFTFDGGANDYAFSSSLDKLEKKIHQYEKQSTDELQTYRNQLSGDEFEKNIGAGSWLKVAAEGWDMERHIRM